MLYVKKVISPPLFYLLMYLYDMKILITESKLKKILGSILNEQDESFNSIENIIAQLNDVVSNSQIKYDEEGYGIPKGQLNWFKRRIGDFNDVLAHNIRYIYNGEFEYIMFESREKFINLILINTLLDFFYKFDEEYAGEDFQRNGEKEGWTYFVKDIYGNELGKIYDEVKNN